MYDLSTFEATQHLCPLCRQTINEEACSLFAAYHGYLTSNLQIEIKTLDNTLENARTTFQKVETFRLSDFSACRDLLPEGTVDAIIAVVNAVIGAVPVHGQPLSSGNDVAFSRSSELLPLAKTIQEAQKVITDAITSGTKDRQELGKKLTETANVIASLRAHQSMSAMRDKVLDLCARSSAAAASHLLVTGYDFAARLRSMTIKGKEAHRDLVLGTFEQRLSREYQALCGATLEEMGVRLSSRGEQQDIIVTPQVGGSPVHRVLSEGEQKVHALAVFMCEADTTPHRVLVLDDPATSFDYNHVSNFCERLRNFVRDHPETQIIVLTHNWDYFINLQTTINRSQLAPRMSVQVLEDCATCQEYNDDWDELCNKIQPIVTDPIEPSAEVKSQLAGWMRRLLERLTNRHVFNDQRHQFKPKALRDSDFHSFTKVVPLTAQEADSLRDIYANLSPPEHDDPRNFYTARPRTQFKLWYEELHRIRAALEARRP
jgi:hypothetical protein